MEILGKKQGLENVRTDYEAKVQKLVENRVTDSDQWIKTFTPDIEFLKTRLEALVDLEKLEDLDFNKLHDAAELLRDEYFKLYSVFKKAPRNYIESWVDVTSFFADQFVQYRDLLFIDRTLELLIKYKVEKLDTILGVDRSARGYAKLLTKTGDLIRKQKSLPKLKSLFLNMHARFPKAATNVDPSYKNNKIFKDHDYGKTLVIDDFTQSGETQDYLLSIKNQLEEEYAVKLNLVGYEYFLTEDSGQFSRQRDLLLWLKSDLHQGGDRYLARSDSDKESPALFSVPKKADEDDVSRSENISSMNAIINKLATTAATVYNNSNL